MCIAFLVVYQHVVESLVARMLTLFSHPLLLHLTFTYHVMYNVLQNAISLAMFISIFTSKFLLQMSITINLYTLPARTWSGESALYYVVITIVVLLFYCVYFILQTLQVVSRSQRKFANIKPHSARK